MSKDPEEFVIIPRESLSEEAFRGLVDEFIQREGTDYGHSEISLEAKRAKVIEQLRTDRAKIVFSLRTGDCTILPAQVVADSFRGGENGIEL